MGSRRLLPAPCSHFHRVLEMPVSGGVQLRWSPEGPRQAGLSDSLLSWFGAPWVAPVRVRSGSAVWKRASWVGHGLGTTGDLLFVLRRILNIKLFIAVTLQSRCCRMPCPARIREPVTTESLQLGQLTSVRYSDTGELLYRWAVWIRLEWLPKRLICLGR